MYTRARSPITTFRRRVRTDFIRTSKSRSTPALDFGGNPSPQWKPRSLKIMKRRSSVSWFGRFSSHVTNKSKMADHKLFKFKLVKITHAASCVIIVFSAITWMCRGLFRTAIWFISGHLANWFDKKSRTSVEGGKNAALADWFRFYYTGPIFQIK